MRARFLAQCSLSVGLALALGAMLDEGLRLSTSGGPMVLPPVRTAVREAKSMRPVLPPAEEAPTIDPGELQAALAHEQRALQRCFQAELRQRATFGGNVQLALAVDGGRVVTAVVEQARRQDAEVGRCMVGVLKRLQFSDGERARIVLPIHLSATEG